MILVVDPLTRGLPLGGVARNGEGGKRATREGEEEGKKVHLNTHVDICDNIFDTSRKI